MPNQLTNLWEVCRKQDFGLRRITRNMTKIEINLPVIIGFYVAQNKKI